MKMRDLTEAADQDLRQVDRAREISAQFMKYLIKFEDSTLHTIPGVYRRATGNGFGLFLDAQTILRDPSLTDLSFGFVTGHPHSKAVLLRSAGPKSHYWACFCVNDDPSDMSDIAFSVSWNDMIHELVHYLDYKRGYDRNGVNTGQREKEVSTLKGRLDYSYYNDPLELNAFYSAALSDIMDQLKFGMKREGSAFAYKVLGSYNAFKDTFQREFRPDWLHHLTPENKKRFEKRFYALWKHLSDNLILPETEPAR